MLSVLRKAASVSSFLTSIRTGFPPASRFTLPGESEAPVTETSKERTVTPAGGASVIERLIWADWPLGGVVVEEDPLQPAMKTTARKATKEKRNVLRMIQHTSLEPMRRK